MIVYHVIQSDVLDTILRHGLKRTSRGSMGADALIAKTDKFLDGLRPENIRQAGVSRDNNLYAYVATDNKIVDIDDGMVTNLNTIVTENNAVLRLEVDPKRCFISDLDIYDSLKNKIEHNEAIVTLEEIATNYWNNVTRLDNTSRGLPRRPEIMITYDVPPDRIEVIR